MIVYGDHAREASATSELAALRERIEAWNEQAERPCVERHGALVDLLVDAGAFAQGLLDATFEARGRTDDVDQLDARVLQFIEALAAAVVASFDGGLRSPPQVSVAELEALEACELPRTIRIKVPEGFAFYALYPEVYVAAARRLPTREVQTIGIRSIGVTLAAVVNAALGGGRAVITVRPQGHPFSRLLKVSERLELKLQEARASHYAIADEGPGLSGSSFASVSRFLQQRGVGAERIHFLPSHAGEPGSAASEETHRAWREHARHVISFDELFLAGAPMHVSRWAEDLTGAIESFEEVSGGVWRARSYVAGSEFPPVYLQQERRKFLATRGGESWLFKFIGLGRSGREAHERARALGEAGFSPRVLGRRNGLLVQPWLEDAQPLSQAPLSPADLADWVGRYLAYRTRALAVPEEGGATLRQLYEMAKNNVGEALGEAVADRISEHELRLEQLQKQVQPAATDNRMHVWEWLVTREGEVLKTDSADHCQAHDLIGSQDLGWDIVGASLELGLSMEAVLDAVARHGGPRPSRELLEFYRVSYAAFQLGHWTMAADAQASFAPEESDRCRAQATKYARALLSLSDRQRARG